LFAPGDETQKLKLVFTALVGFQAQKNRRCPASLGDHDGLLRCLDVLQGCGGILPKVGDGNDVRHPGHKRNLQRYV
jgi:hypothetical protein